MFRIEDKSIVYNASLRYTFDDYIAEALPFDDAIVVRLENQGWKRINENVCAVDYQGRLLWRIPKRIHAYGDSPYVNLYRRNEMVDVYNWDGTILTFHPKTGELMSESMVQVSTRHTASKRSFI